MNPMIFSAANDNKSIKALQCCAAPFDCANCPAQPDGVSRGTTDCMSQTINEVLQIIANQRAQLAQIDRISRKETICDYTQRLKQSAETMYKTLGVTARNIERIAQEMMEENNV